MSRRFLVLDTKPLVLYVIGLIDSKYVPKFVKTKEFTTKEFVQLADFVGGFQEIWITPYILNEFAHHTIEEKTLRDDYKKQIISFIQRVSQKEIFFANPPVKKIFKNNAIYLHGAADTSILEMRLGRNVTLVTSDGVFADEARVQGRNVVKFLPTIGIADY